MAHNVISWITRFLSHLSSKIAPIKSDNPSAALESLERWSAVATIVIFFGIALDAWATIHFQKSDETNWEVAAKLFADFCIGSGLLVEVVCILRTIVESRREKAESDSKVAEAYERVAQLEFESGYTQERIAMAAERAAKAELETTKLRAKHGWRRVEPSAFTEMGLALRGSPASVVIQYPQGDMETAGYVTQLYAAFTQAGWDVAFIAATYFAPITWGIVVPNIESEVSSRIHAALSRARIEFVLDDLPSISGMSHEWGEAPPPRVAIYVGPMKRY